MTGKRSSVASAVWLFACISLLASVTSGCASIIGGLSGDDEIEFTSEPTGAVVTVANGQSCTAPCKLVVKPIVTQKAKAVLAGYDVKEQTLRRRIAYPFWANIALGTLGLITAGIDWWDGYIWTYSARHVHFALAGGEEPPEAPPPLPPVAAPTEAADSAALQRLKKSYSEDYMLEQIRNYYGGQTPDMNRKILARLYQRMLKMQEQGDDVDVDEAVREDRFEQLNEPPPAADEASPQPAI